MKKVSFDTQIIENKKKSLFTDKYLNKKTARFKKNYTPKKALDVGIRLHQEIKNPEQFKKRYSKEIMAEKLLIHNNLYIHVNTVYRLSDYKINILLQRLIHIN